MERFGAIQGVASRGLVIAAAAAAALVAGSLLAAGTVSSVPRSDDPRQDGWETEAFQAAVRVPLERVAGVLRQPSAAAGEALGEILAPGFTTTPLRPELRPVFDDGSLRVLRPPPSMEVGDPLQGADGLFAALRALASPLAGHRDVRVEIKIIRVALAAGAGSTRQALALSGRAPGSSVEIHTSWDAEWILEPGQSPRLRSLRARDDYQESRFSGEGPTLYSDRTAGVLAHNPSFGAQLMRGTWSWLAELEAALGPDMMGHQGLAVGDVDGDGLEDLYAPQLGGLPNRLFLHREDGTADDRSAWAGVDWLDRSQSALLVDLDDDGDKDLVVGTAPALLMMANDGRGRFTLRAAFRAASYAYSLAAADADLDGDLDLYVSRYAPLPEDPGATIDVPSPVPYHDAENGAPNFLLRNDGDWRFADATDETGLDADNRRWSFAASFEDYDNDGDPDLYVANDFGRNCLYRNDLGAAGQPRFVNVAAEVGVEDVASGMSVSWGDADADGWMDLYVGNMFSAAGNRVTFQDRFQPRMAADEKALVQRLARGNSLFLNQAASREDGRPGVAFADVSLDAGVTLGRWAWGSIFADLNNDGWQDLVVANGYLTAPLEDDL